MRPEFWHVRRSQIYRNAGRRVAATGIFYGCLYPFAAFLNRGIGQTHHYRRWQAVGHVRLHFYEFGVQPDYRRGKTFEIIRKNLNI